MELSDDSSDNYRPTRELTQLELRKFVESFYSDVVAQELGPCKIEDDIIANDARISAKPGINCLSFV